MFRRASKFKICTMKLFVVTLLAVASVACGLSVEEAIPDNNTAWGYLTRFGVPRAEQIRKAEEAYLNDPSRIVGGVPAAVGQYAYQAGLISDIIGITGRGVCGGSLVSADRVITAAHCWSDGVNQAWRFTVVLGSVLLFTGGTRIESSAVVTHPSWFPLLVRNDVAVIFLPSQIQLSATINTVALPTGSQLSNNFAGTSAIASGFGITSDGAGVSTDQFLSHVNLNIITNSICSYAFPLILQESNICTSGLGGIGVCSGDSGGPLVVNIDGTPTLVGITSFGSALGCQINLPSAFARVTSFMEFFNQHI